MVDKKNSDEGTENNIDARNEHVSRADFESFAERIEGKFSDFGRDLGRLRSKTKAGVTPPDAPKQEQKADPTTDVTKELREGRRLIRLMAKLPEDVAAGIDQQLDDGDITLREAVRFAEFATKLGKSAASAGSSKVDEDEGAKPSTPTAKGSGARPAPSAPGAPRSLAELRKLAAADDGSPDRQRFERLMADPNFDYRKLTR